MAIDFSKPVPADGYVALLAGIQAALTGLAQGLEPTDSGTHTSVPTNARRWNATSNKWEKFTGAAWVDNSALYAINISGAAGTVPFTGLTGGVTVWNQNTTGTAANVTGVVAVANGGTGAAAIPTWNQDTTGKAGHLSGGVAGAVHYQSGVGASGFSLAGTAGQTLVSGGALAPTWTSSPTFVTPALGTPASGTLTNCTLPYGQLSGAPTVWNQNTTGSSASCTGNAGTATTLTSFAPAGVTEVGRYFDFHGSTNANDYDVRLDCGLTGTNGGGTLTVTAAVLACTGNISAYSDERLKKNWRNLSSDFIPNLAAVKVGIYDRIDAGLTQVGVSAQSLQKVMPDAVLTGEDGMLSVAYGNAALAACVELAKAVVLLQAEIERVRAA